MADMTGVLVNCLGWCNKQFVNKCKKRTWYCPKCKTKKNEIEKIPYVFKKYKQTSNGEFVNIPL